jgi:MarR family transcriptional regulator, organic hydroperoxide resistance regulator
MSKDALQACVDRHLEHAALVFMLDEELGTHHGLSWADFVLLTVLDAADGAAPATELARSLRMPASQLLLRLLPLEKTGLVARAADGDGKRRVTLRPPGRRLLHEARDTAADACAT